MTNRRKIVQGTVLFFTLICAQLVYPQTAQAKVRLSKLEAKRACVLELWYDSYEKKYSSYDFALSAEGSYPSTDYCKDIAYIAEKGTDSLVARFTNTGSNTYDYIHVSAVFYDRNGHCIGYDSHYIDTLKPGDTAIKDFSYPDDEEDNSIKPASYEIYIESADLR